ncbi:MAG: DUF2207 domain-containing protein [Novosphingobium sp.]
MRWLGAVVAALLALPLAASAQEPVDRAALIRAWELSKGEERILSYRSDIAVEADGDLDVTETIRVVALNQAINHGIYRDFPTTYGGFLKRDRKGFEVLSVRRDGKDEPWARESLSNGVRIKIGSADTTVPIGDHTYVIRYRTTRQLILGKDSDEIYWNVTGNGWKFPIDRAEARITLPAATKFGNRAVYTGPQGSTARNAEVFDERPGYIAFRTTAPLAAEEGLTVAAAFPKAVLTPLTATQQRLEWLADWGAWIVGGLSLLGLGWYFIQAWAVAGRGPKAGPVVPAFSPPDGLTPAAMRYVAEMKFDNRAFTAAIVDLGVRGQVHISKEDGGWFAKDTTTLRRTDLGRTGGNVPGPEAAMRDKLFAADESIELKQANHATLQAARTALEKGLEAAYSGKLFLANKDWAVLGLLAIPGAMLVIAILAVLFDPSSGPASQVLIPLVAVGLLGGAWWLYRWTRTAEGGLKILAWIILAIIGIAGAMFTFSTVFAALSLGAFGTLLPLLMLPVAITAFRWMYAPTAEGRAVMDRVAGFKHYLGVTEEHRLDTLHPPEKTPELFERYLPYAIALEVENRWADRFVTVLATAAAAGAAAHGASWYSGSGNMWDDPRGFADTIGSSLDRTVSSAATSPSSGGSSGSGSSGGGGGGGGGGGW